MAEIYLKEFHKKFNVKASNKNMRKTYKLELAMAKAGDLEEKEPFEQIQATLDMTDGVVSYITELLKLNEAQQEILDDLEANETIALSNHIAMRLMGMSEEDIKKANKNTDSKEEKKATVKE